MKRILVTERSGMWEFETPRTMVTSTSPLLAAIKAMAFGDSLRGKALGYVVRIDTGSQVFALHTRIF